MSRLGIGLGLTVRRGGGPAWTPVSLGATLAIYFDPLFGTFQERTGAAATTPAVANNDPVGTWAGRDESGIIAYAVAPSDAARPLISIVSGRSYVLYDGTNDELSTASVNLATANDWTLAYRSLDIGGSTPFKWTMPNHIQIFNQRNLRRGAAGTDLTATNPDGGVDGKWVWRGTGAASDCRLNSAANGTGANTALAGFSAVLEIGHRNHSNFWNGRYGRIVLVNSYVTGADLANLEAYL